MLTKKSGNRIRNLALDVLCDLVGGLLFSIGLQSFSAPNNIAPGGVSGLSIIINYLTGLPVSVLSLALNIPLLLMAWFLIGRPFTVKTLKSVLIITVMLELANQLLPAYTGEMILSCVYAGVLQGVGLALVFMRGSTTGGSDVASRLIQLKFPHIPVGRLMLLVDAGVLLLSAVVFRSVESALYAMITIFVCSRIIDSILYGLNTGQVILIFSEERDAIIREISHSLERGCTVLEGKGGYTHQDRPVVLCAIRKSQYYDLKRIVHEADPAAFLVAVEAGEILGEGFRMPGEGVQT